MHSTVIDPAKVPNLDKYHELISSLGPAGRAAHDSTVSFDIEAFTDIKKRNSYIDIVEAGAYVPNALEDSLTTTTEFYSPKNKHRIDAFHKERLATLKGVGVDIPSDAPRFRGGLKRLTGILKGANVGVYNLDFEARALLGRHPSAESARKSGMGMFYSSSGGVGFGPDLYEQYGRLHGTNELVAQKAMEAEALTSKYRATGTDFVKARQATIDAGRVVSKQLSSSNKASKLLFDQQIISRAFIAQLQEKGLLKGVDWSSGISVNNLLQAGLGIAESHISTLDAAAAQGLTSHMAGYLLEGESTPVVQNLIKNFDAQQQLHIKTREQQNIQSVIEAREGRLFTQQGGYFEKSVNLKRVSSGGDKTIGEAYTMFISPTARRTGGLGYGYLNTLKGNTVEEITSAIGDTVRASYVANRNIASESVDELTQSAIETLYTSLNKTEVPQVEKKLTTAAGSMLKNKLADIGPWKIAGAITGVGLAALSIRQIMMGMSGIRQPYPTNPNEFEAMKPHPGTAFPGGRDAWWRTVLGVQTSQSALTTADKKLLKNMPYKRMVKKFQAALPDVRIQHKAGKGSYSIKGSEMGSYLDIINVDPKQFRNRETRKAVLIHELMENTRHSFDTSFGSHTDRTVITEEIRIAKALGDDVWNDFADLRASEISGYVQSLATNIQSIQKSITHLHQAVEKGKYSSTFTSLQTQLGKAKYPRQMGKLYNFSPKEIDAIYANYYTAEQMSAMDQVVKEGKGFRYNFDPKNNINRIEFHGIRQSYPTNPNEFEAMKPHPGTDFPGGRALTNATISLSEKITKLFSKFSGNVGKETVSKVSGVVKKMGGYQSILNMSVNDVAKSLGIVERPYPVSPDMRPNKGIFNKLLNYKEKSKYQFEKFAYNAAPPLGVAKIGDRFTPVYKGLDAGDAIEQVFRGSSENAKKVALIHEKSEAVALNIARSRSSISFMDMMKNKRVGTHTGSFVMDIEADAAKKLGVFDEMKNIRTEELDAYRKLFSRDLNMLEKLRHSSSVTNRGMKRFMDRTENAYSVYGIRQSDGSSGFGSIHGMKPNRPDFKAGRTPGNPHSMGVAGILGTAALGAAGVLAFLNVKSFITPTTSEWGRASKFGVASQNMWSGVAEELEEEMSSDSLSIVTSGTATHAAFQKRFNEMFPESIPEFTVIDYENKITGHIDIVAPVQLPGTKGVTPIPIEVKTISASGFNQLTGPKPEHQAQSQFYLHYLTKQYKKNVPYEMFLYVNRSNPTQVKIFQENRDEKKFQRYLKRYRSYQAAAKDRGYTPQKLTSNVSIAAEMIAQIGEKQALMRSRGPAPEDVHNLLFETARSYTPAASGIDRSDAHKYDFNSPHKKVWTAPSAEVAQQATSGSLPTIKTLDQKPSYKIKMTGYNGRSKLGQHQKYYGRRPNSKPVNASRAGVI